MKGFSGFPDGKLRLTQVPNLFFSEVLPIIDHLAELKVALYAFWALGQKEGNLRYLRLTDFLNDQTFMAALGPTPTQAAAALTEGLERAVARGLFLHVNVESADGLLELYFLNSERGRAAVEGITRGEWRPGPDDAAPISLLVERPNIFVLYEQNIGPLTPLIADELRDAEKSYPMHWIEEAFERAVQNNVRRWRYVDAILERWRLEGRGDASNQRDSRKELGRQVPEEYRHIVKR
ncbi:MAG: DnaD domain-containing protein [Candidatus Promineifilaceae bacterium]